MAYDADAVKRLKSTARACPVTTDLNQTINYVDKLLDESFDDPYTTISPPDVAEQFRERMAGTEEAFKGGGIGLSLSFDPTKTLPADPKAASKDQEPRLAFTGLVFHAFADQPGAKAGVMDGDVITKVNGEVVTGQDANHVVNDLMRGPVGTEVSITVMRGTSEHTFKITRSSVVSDNVWSRDLGNGIYSIVVTEFRQDTAAMIFNEVEKVMPKARGFVFDVRGNPGGILDEAIMAAAWFVHDGVIVSQRERIMDVAGEPKYVTITYTRVGPNVLVKTVDESTGQIIGLRNIQVSMAKADPVTGKITPQATENIPFLGYKPMVVVANGSSASASEVFTGAMSQNYIGGTAADQDNPTADSDPQGATFLGVQTYGKGIGQTVYSGPFKVQIKATSFRYFLPHGDWIGDAHKHRIGITPSVNVKQADTAVPYTSSDAQINAAIDLINKEAPDHSSTP